MDISATTFIEHKMGTIVVAVEKHWGTLLPMIGPNSADPAISGMVQTCFQMSFQDVMFHCHLTREASMNGLLVDMLQCPLVYRSPNQQCFYRVVVYGDDFALIPPKQVFKSWYSRSGDWFPFNFHAVFGSQKHLSLMCEEDHLRLAHRYGFSVVERRFLPEMEPDTQSFLKGTFFLYEAMNVGDFPEEEEEQRPRLEADFRNFDQAPFWAWDQQEEVEEDMENVL